MELSQTPFSMDERYLGFLKHPGFYSICVHQLHGSELSKMASRCVELETKALLERRDLKAIDGRQSVQNKNNYQVYSKSREMCSLEDQADHEEMVSEPCQSVDNKGKGVDLHSPCDCSFKYKDRPRYISWSSCRSVSYVSDPGGRSSEAFGSSEMAAKQEVKSFRAAGSDISEFSHNSGAKTYSKIQQGLPSKTGKEIHVQVVPLVHTLRFRNPSEADYKTASASCSCQTQTFHVPDNRAKRVWAVPELEHLKNRQIRLPPVYTSRSPTSFLFVGVNFVSRFRRVVLRVKSKFRRSSFFDKRLDRKYGFSSVLKGPVTEDSSIRETETETFTPKCSTVTLEQSSTGISQKDKILELVLPTLSDVFTALLSYHAEDTQSEYEHAAYNLVEELCLKKAEFFSLAPRWEYLAICVSLDDRLLGEVLWECMLEGKKATDEYRERQGVDYKTFLEEQNFVYPREEEYAEEDEVNPDGLYSLPGNEIRENNVTETGSAGSEEGLDEIAADRNPWQEPSIYRFNPCYLFTSRHPLTHGISQVDDDFQASCVSDGFICATGCSDPQLDDLWEPELNSMGGAVGSIENPPSGVDRPIEGPLVKQESVEFMYKPPAASPERTLEPPQPSESGAFLAGPSETKDQTTDRPRGPRSTGSARSPENDKNSSIPLIRPPTPPAPKPPCEESKGPLSHINEAEAPAPLTKEAPKAASTLSRPPTAPSRPTTAYKKNIPGQRIRNIVSQFDSMAVPYA